MIINKFISVIYNELIKQLVNSFSIDIIKYIEQFGIYKRLAIKKSKFYEGQDCLYKNIVTYNTINKNTKIYLSFIPTKELYSFDMQDILYIILHYKEVFNEKIIPAVDNIMDKELSKDA